MDIYFLFEEKTTKKTSLRKETRESSRYSTESHKQEISTKTQATVILQTRDKER